MSRVSGSAVAGIGGCGRGFPATSCGMSAGCDVVLLANGRMCAGSHPRIEAVRLGLRHRTTASRLLADRKRADADSVGLEDDDASLCQGVLESRAGSRAAGGFLLSSEDRDARTCV